MSWDYLDDVYGKSRERKTRFTDLEAEAKALLTSFVKCSISNREFVQAFNEVEAKYVELTTVNGHSSIDQDTPLWLNMLLGLHFVKWYRYQQVKWYFEEHPEKLTGETQEEFYHIQQMGIDDDFRNKCYLVLKELS